jgi:hypothetical protein
VFKTAQVVVQKKSGFADTFISPHLKMFAPHLSSLTRIQPKIKFVSSAIKNFFRATTVL